MGNLNQCCQAGNKGEDTNTIHSKLEETTQEKKNGKQKHTTTAKKSSSLDNNQEVEVEEYEDQQENQSQDPQNARSFSKVGTDKSDREKSQQTIQEQEKQQSLNKNNSKEEDDGPKQKQGTEKSRSDSTKAKETGNAGNSSIHQQSTKDKKEDINQSTKIKSSSKQSSKGEKKLTDLSQSQKQGDFNISADIFIHLKKGNISDNYQVCETLGEGAFGHVSKVVHKTTKMVRAMKVLKKSSLIKEEEQKLFSEMTILRQLDHPHIIRLFELFQDNKSYYLITEFCGGGELFDKIKGLQHFSEKMGADYMKQLLSALVYMHKHGIVHRDLKPENLILESDQKNAPLKVIDFGTARKLDAKKKMTKRLGTPYYIAPEVLNQNYDEKCDVWSCGVILYIILCGYPPFGGRTEEEILKRVKSGKYKFEPEDWDQISSDAKSLIRKMLQVEPKKRISAEQALNDPWIQKNAPQLAISNKAMTNLSHFQTKSKMKQAILTFIVSQIAGREEKEELSKTFRQLDKNGDGKLSKEELIEGYLKVYGNRDQAIQQVEGIMNQVDTNKSGVVDFTEFLMAAMQKDIILSKQKIHQAFTMFDQDGNGYIERLELEQIMGQFDDNTWQGILDECDTNKDGKISQNEFIELLTKKRM